MKRILFIDGANAAHRFRHAYANFQTTKGTRTGVTFGFMEMLNNLLRDYPGTTDVYVFWEGGNNWRYKYYAGYKAARRQRRENMTAEESADYKAFLAHDIPKIKELLPKLGVRNVEIRGCEADDSIALAVAAFKMRGVETDIIIVSTDADFIQLVNAGPLRDSPVRVRVENPYTKAMFSQSEESYVISSSSAALVAISPLNYLLQRCVVGDSSDGIAGVVGIGPRRAYPLCNEALWRTGMSYADYKSALAPRIATKGYSQRLLTADALIYRNLILMALLPPYNMLGYKKAGTSLNAAITKCCEYLDVKPEASLLTGSATSDPSAFLTYFRRLEFGLASNPVKAGEFKGRLQNLVLRRVRG